MLPPESQELFEEAAHVREVFKNRAPGKEAAEHFEKEISEMADQYRRAEENRPFSQQSGGRFAPDILRIKRAG